MSCKNQWRRHRWDTNAICIRCRKERNNTGGPKAMNMFRPRPRRSIKRASNGGVA